MINSVQDKIQQVQQCFQYGQLSQANQYLEELSRFQDDTPVIRLLRAQYYFLNGDYDLSEQALHDLAHLERLPDDLIDPLAHQLNRQEQFFSLAQLLEIKLSKNPQPQLRFQYALCLMKLGKIAQALSIFSELQANQFSHPLLNINVGHAHKAMGDSAAAAESYIKALSTTPELAGTAYWSLADLKNYRFDQQQVRQLKTLIENPQLNPQERALCGFAHGNAQEQLNNYGAAFDCFLMANKLITQSRQFNKTGFEHLKKSLLKTTVNKDTAASHGDKRMIFIVGMPRSGTTLTEQILASHNQVTATDELPYIERIAMQICKDQSYDKALVNLDREECERFARHYLRQAQMHAQSDNPVLLDKNPNNWLHSALILKLFPNAVIINLSRPANDNLLSVFKQHFSAGQDYSYDLQSLKYYIKSYYELMTHWHCLEKERLFTLDYAALVNSPEIQIRKLLKACKLPFDSQCLRFFESDRTVLTPSSNQVKQPIYKKAINISAPYMKKLIQHLPDINELETNRRRLLQPL